MTGLAKNPEQAVGYGCLGLILLPCLIGLIVSFWPVFLGLAVLLFLVWLGKKTSTADTVKAIIQKKDRVISLNGKFCFVEGVDLRDDSLFLIIDSLEGADNGRIDFISKDLALGKWHECSGKKVKTIFATKGIDILSPLSIEARAMETARKCHEEINWCNSSLAKLDKLKEGIDYGLSVAQGNPLLEPSTGQMLDMSFKTNKNISSIGQTLLELKSKLEDIFEFLSVPAAVRGSLTDKGWDNFVCHGLKEAKESYLDLIALSQAYSELSDYALH